MSLVGNLEDLSLGDIMQIISLSQKSGVLALEGEQGSGRIVFQSGMVHAACVKGRPDDLRGLLVRGGLVEGPAFDEFAVRAQELGLPVEETIAREGGLSSEQIDALLRESVEAAILEMFSWSSGDFSFDMRGKLEPDDPQLRLSSGINAQFLAMEGMRVHDERSRDDSPAAVGPSPTTSSVDSFPSVDTMFGDESVVAAPEVDDEVSAADVLVATVVSREDERSGPEPENNPAASTPAAIVKEQASGEASPRPLRQDCATQTTPVILIDPDVSVLEWLKTTIQDDFARVHVFQQAEQGLARIRQYLIRGELPVVLISTEIRIDALSGIHGLGDFVERLKAQSARLVVVGLHQDEDGSPPAMQKAFDGMLVRPDRKQLREGSETVTSKTAKELVCGLRQILVDRNSTSGTSTAGPPAKSSESVPDVRSATDRLQEAPSRGEILPVVLDFASGLFARVAILIIREEWVFAIAGRGIGALEMDPLGSAAPISLQALDSGWIQNVLQSGEPIQGPPTTPADRELLARLGGVEPAAAYLGPIESGGSTIALLYGDQVPDGAEMPDTSGLEEVLHHAGLALHRAALDRALWEPDTGQR